MAGATAQRLGRARIAADVPVRLQPNPDQPIAALALLLLDAGVLRDRDLHRRRTWLTNTCQKSLDAWAAQHSAGLRIFKPTLSFRVGADHYDGRAPQATNTPLALRIEWYATDAPYLIVGPAIAHLEDRHRGLGGTVMRSIGQTSWRSLPVFAFDDQLRVASYTLWGGTENLDEYLESYGLDAEEAAQMRENCIDRQTILDHTPPWVLSVRQADGLTDRALQRIAKRGADPFCQAVASALLDLRATPPCADYLHDLLDNGGEFIGFGAVLRWSEDDHTLTVLDALWEQAHNSGDGLEICGYHTQAIDDVAALHAWLANLAAMLAIVRRLDALIALLADFNAAGARP